MEIKLSQSNCANEQIVGVLKEQESGIPSIEVGRKHGVGTASFYDW
jgi:putative transposase